MKYVIYNVNTTYLLNDKTYSSISTARSALTRALNKGWIHERSEWEIAESTTFRYNIEKTKIVKNLLSGAEIAIPVNTPHCCDPSTERYWTM